MANYVPGNGYSKAKLLILGEAPGKDENLSRKPFTGSAGNVLDDILEANDISRNEVWLTNVYKHQPPFNQIRRIKEVCDPEQEEANTLKEIEEINPNCILALGNTASKFITRNTNKITDIRGSIFLSPNSGKKVVPTYHPAAFLFGQTENAGKKVPFSHKYISIFDVGRAKEESLTDKYDIPSRRISICRNSASLFRELQPYRDELFVSVDIEVIKCIPVSISLSYNDYSSIVVPLVSLHKLQEKWFIPTEELTMMHMLLIEALNRVKFIIGQNLKFDQAKLEITTGWGKFLDSWRDRVIDTSILAHCLYPEFPKNLGFLTSIFTREPYYKDEGKEFNYKKNDFKQFFLYNGKDSAVTYEIFLQITKELKALQVPKFPNWYKEFVENYSFKLHDFYKDMETVGMRVDEQKRKFYFDKYTNIYREQRKRLNEVAGFECNPHSNTKDVPLLLYRELKLPRRKDCSRQTLIALLNNVAKQPRQKEAIQLVLDSRRVRKARNTYYGAALDYDGRMRTSYSINGTETGRRSTRILKAPVRPIKMGIAFQTMTKHGDIGHELREIFIPDDGYAFVEIDLSQAEARVVALLSKDEELLRKFYTGVDVHSEMAAVINGIKWDGKRLPKEPRFLGKMGRHARNYDVGKKTFMQQVNADAKKHGLNLNISEFRAGKILEAVRAVTPLVEQTFHTAIKDIINDDRILINPFGRRRQFFGRWDDQLYKEAYAFIPQSTVIDHLTLGCFRARDRMNSEKYYWFMEAHDAIYALVKLDYIDEYCGVMNEELNKPIDFSRCTIERGELVIPCEIQIGYENLKEMKEYHVGHKAA